MQPKLFLHIPKTAGTSLIESLSAIHGHDAIERDYGGEASYSSALVKEHIYAAPTLDEYAFWKAFTDAEKKWLCGHFHADRYVHMFGALNTVAFVRDPIERVISEYQYLVKKHHLERPFEDFYRSPEETNKQFRMIGQSPWRALHLVGSLEAYGACLELLSASLKHPLPEAHANINRHADKAGINTTTREDIAKWNERDLLFVEEVRCYLAARLEFHKAGTPFCFHDLGFVPDTHIIGWAFMDKSEAPVELGLFVDGILKETVKAMEHRPELQLVHTPRGGHNGFRFVLAPYASATQITLKVMETDQVLFDWQRPE